MRHALRQLSESFVALVGGTGNDPVALFASQNDPRSRLQKTLHVLFSGRSGQEFPSLRSEEAGDTV